jgi:hypothetical protein
MTTMTRTPNILWRRNGRLCSNYEAIYNEQLTHLSESRYNRVLLYFLVRMADDCNGHLSDDDDEREAPASFGYAILKNGKDLTHWVTRQRSNLHSLAESDGDDDDDSNEPADLHATSGAAGDDFETQMVGQGFANVCVCACACMCV